MFQILDRNSENTMPGFLAFDLGDRYYEIKPRDDGNQIEIITISENVVNDEYAKTTIHYNVDIYTMQQMRALVKLGSSEPESVSIICTDPERMIELASKAIYDWAQFLMDKKLVPE